MKWATETAVVRPAALLAALKQFRCHGNDYRKTRPLRLDLGNFHLSITRIQSMSKAISNLQAAQQRAMAGRPKVDGFPYLAETPRIAGVTRNLWFLPACESLYLTREGPVVVQGTPLIAGAVDVPRFDQEALILPYGKIRQATAHFRSSSQRPGMQG
jgi:uncharacterized protein YbcV (DUF1398 family)